MSHGYEQQPYIDEYGRHIPDHSYLNSSNGASPINSNANYRQSGHSQHQKKHTQESQSYQDYYDQQHQGHKLLYDFDRRQYTNPQQAGSQHQQYQQRQYSQNKLIQSPQRFHNNQSTNKPPVWNTNHLISANNNNNNNNDFKFQHSIPSPHQSRNSMNSYIQLTNRRSPLNAATTSLHRSPPNAGNSFNAYEPHPRGFNYNSPYQIKSLQVGSNMPTPATNNMKAIVAEFTSSTIGFEQNTHQRLIIIEDPDFKSIMSSKSYWDEHEETEEVKLFQSGPTYMLFVLFTGGIPRVSGYNYRRYINCREYYVRDPSKVYIRGIKKRAKNQLRFDKQDVASLFQDFGDHTIEIDDEFYVIHVADQTVLQGIKNRFKSRVENGKLVLLLSLEAEISTIRVLSDNSSDSEFESDLESSQKVIEISSPINELTTPQSKPQDQKTKHPRIQTRDILKHIRNNTPKTTKGDKKKVTKARTQFPEETKTIPSEFDSSTLSLLPNEDEDEEEGLQSESKLSTKEGSVSNKDLIKAINDNVNESDDDIIMSHSSTREPHQPESPIISDLEDEKMVDKDDKDIKEIESHIISDSEDERDNSVVLSSDIEDEGDFKYTKFDKNHKLTLHDIDTAYLIIRHIPHTSEIKFLQFIDDIISRLSLYSLKCIYGKKEHDQVLLEFLDELDVLGAIRNLHGFVYKGKVLVGVLCDEVYAREEYVLRYFFSEGKIIKY